GPLQLKLLSHRFSGTPHAVRSIIVLPLALVVGFAAGFAWFRGPAPLSPLHESDGRRALLAEGNDPRTWPDSPSATDGKAQVRVGECLRKGNRLEREAEMYRIIEALTADDFRRIMGDLGALKAMAEKLDKVEWATKNGLASGLIGRWLKVDRDAAI